MTKAHNPTGAARPGKSGTVKASAREKLFALVAGLWLALTFLKFGNPIIFGGMLPTPQDFAEFVFTPWPLLWAYMILLGVVVFGLAFVRPEFGRDDWPMAALGAWVVWQFFSMARSIDQGLSTATVVHFAACVISLLLGWWAVARLPDLRWFWIPVLIGFSYVLISGFDQRNGGLESMRRAFYEQPDWQSYPKEYLLKMQSDRIFSTLVYPNTFAQLILLVLPVSLWKLWGISVSWPRILRGVAVGLLGYLGVCCLYWTGSKGGWLVALVMLLALVLHFGIPPKLKVAIMAGSLVLGLTFFFLRFGGYFQKGATSVGARFIYWQGAARTASDNPILGTGPGTFAVAFRKIKPAEAEMAKLVHNDYLEQASDSGMPGAFAYAAFVFGTLTILYRQRPAGEWEYLLIWLGLLGAGLQAFIEFGLYIPAIAWTTFFFTGLLWKRRERESFYRQR